MTKYTNRFQMILHLCKYLFYQKIIQRILPILLCNYNYTLRTIFQMLIQVLYESYLKNEASRGALEEVKYLFTFVFSFLRSIVEAKRGVEFRHSTRNASRTRWKVGNGVFKILQVPSVYPAVCGVQRESDLFIFILYLKKSCELLIYIFYKFCVTVMYLYFLEILQTLQSKFVISLFVYIYIFSFLQYKMKLHNRCNKYIRCTYVHTISRLY